MRKSRKIRAKLAARIARFEATKSRNDKDNAGRKRPGSQNLRKG